MISIPNTKYYIAYHFYQLHYFHQFQLASYDCLVLNLLLLEYTSSTDTRRINHTIPNIEGNQNAIPNIEGNQNAIPNIEGNQNAIPNIEKIRRLYQT